MEHTTKESGVGGLIAHWNTLGAEWSAMARRFSQYGDEEAALRCHERAAMVTDMIAQLREVWGMANVKDELRY